MQKIYRFPFTMGSKVKEEKKKQSVVLGYIRMSSISLPNLIMPIRDGSWRRLWTLVRMINIVYYPFGSYATC